MFVFTPFDGMVLGVLGILLVFGIVIASLLVRQVARDMQDASAAIEILRDHPELLMFAPSGARFAGGMNSPSHRRLI